MFGPVLGCDCDSVSGISCGAADGILVSSDGDGVLVSFEDDSVSGISSDDGTADGFKVGFGFDVLSDCFRVCSDVLSNGVK